MVAIEGLLKVVRHAIVEGLREQPLDGSTLTSLFEGEDETISTWR